MDFDFEYIGSIEDGDETLCGYSFSVNENNTGLSIGGYAWEFDQGSPSISSNAEPVVYFPSGGEYDICLDLALWGECTLREKLCKTVTADCPPPCDDTPCSTPPCITDFGWTANGCTVTFDDTSSPPSFIYEITSPDDPSLNITNQFGSSQTHTFPASGIYEVCISSFSFSPCGNGQACHFVEVNCDPIFTECSFFTPPVANFSTNSTTEDCSLLIFNDLSNPGQVCEDITDWYWDFGDGEVLHATNGDPFVHEYGFEGTYEVCLTVENSCGCTDTHCLSQTIDCTENCQAVIGYPAGGCSPIGCDEGNCTWCFEDFSRPSSCADIISRTWQLTRGNGAVETYSGQVINFCSQGQNETIEVCLTVVDSKCCESTVCETMNICREALSGKINPQEDIISPEPKKNLTIFPNPANDELTLSNPNEDQLEVTIISVSGKTMSEIKVGAFANKKIQVENYPNGIYFLQILNTDNNEHLETKKVVIAR